MNDKASLALRGLFWAVATVAPSLGMAQTQTPQDRMQPNIILLELTGQNLDKHDLKSFGTGFLISRDGYALTSAHLYDDLVTQGAIPGSINITARVGDVGAPEVKVASPPDRNNHDVALVKLDPKFGGYSFAPLMCTSRPFELRDRTAYTLGFHSHCFVASSDGCLKQRPWLGAGGHGDLGPSGGAAAMDTRDLIGYHFNNGDSGSPVFSPGGVVIGIAKGDSISDVNASVIVPISWGSEFLNHVGGQACVDFAKCAEEKTNAGQPFHQTGSVESPKTDLFHVEYKRDHVCYTAPHGFQIDQTKLLIHDDGNVGGRGSVSEARYRNDPSGTTVEACVEVRAWSESTIFGNSGRQNVSLLGSIKALETDSNEDASAQCWVGKN